MTKSSHLEHIDFIKGVAAISVILLHTLPISLLQSTFAVFHIWQAVPVFLFITYYLGFRSLDNKGLLGDYYSKVRIRRIVIHIWLPLVILAVVEALFFFIIGDKTKAIGCLLCYDNGPGSYYIWCYMQIWLLLPFIYLLLKKCNVLIGGSILLIGGVLLDFLWEQCVGIKAGYTCFRYLFLSVPAYMTLKGASLRKQWPLCFISFVYLFLIQYSKLPIYANPVLPDGWEFQTGLGYFYTLLLFVAISALYHNWHKSALIIKRYFTHLGTISWEVFLVQMVLLGSGVLNYASELLFKVTYLQVLFRVSVALIISLLIAELYTKFLNSIIRV